MRITSPTNTENRTYSRLNQIQVCTHAPQDSSVSIILPGGTSARLSEPPLGFIAADGEPAIFLTHFPAEAPSALLVFFFVFFIRVPHHMAGGPTVGVELRDGQETSDGPWKHGGGHPPHPKGNNRARRGDTIGGSPELDPLPASPSSNPPRPAARQHGCLATRL